MFKFFITFILAFLTIYSPLSNLGVELHLLEHDHHVQGVVTDKHTHAHEETREIRQDVSLLDLVHHHKNNRDANHQHEMNKSDVLSLQASSLMLLKTSQLLYKTTSDLKLLQTTHYALAQNLPKRLNDTYFPTPHSFRNLPLLN